MKSDQWSRVSRPLVERYGEAAVMRAGFASLGYPAIWIHTHGEVLSVLRELELRPERYGRTESKGA